jgi:hypothetical protein
MSQQHPALSPERQSFREPYALRLVTAREEGVPIHRLPEGVYGFTGSPASEELPLFMVPTFRCFEVHKQKGGAVALIGYLTEKQHGELQTATAKVSLDLFPDPYEEATLLVSILLSQIDHRKLPARDAGCPMRIDVSPR